MTTPTGQLVFEIAACDGHFRYNVTFEGADASEQALAHILRKDKEHRRYNGLGDIVWALIEERSDYAVLSDELYKFLYPSCEHGLSAALCMGPGHYPTGHPYE